MDLKCFIYVLYDPDTREARYVGKTITGKRRLRTHFSSSRRRIARGVAGKRHCERWIDKLGRDSKVPGWDVLAYCEKDRLDEEERAWIAYFKEIGCNLTNMTPGGEGGICTDETREKLRSLWVDPEYRAKRSRITKEALTRPELKASLSAAATKRNFARPETIRIKARDSIIASWTPEKRAAHSAKMKAYWSDPNAKGRKRKQWSEERRAKQLPKLLAQILSPEHRAKTSSSLTGRKLSDEHRAAVSRGKTGRPQSEKQKAAQARGAASRRGKPNSESHRKAISEARKKYFAARRSQLAMDV